MVDFGCVVCIPPSLASHRPPPTKDADTTNTNTPTKTQGAVWQDLALGETVCHTLSGFLAHNLERLVGPEDAKALQQPGVRSFVCVCVL